MFFEVPSRNSTITSTTLDTALDKELRAKGERTNMHRFFLVCLSDNDLALSWVVIDESYTGGVPPPWKKLLSAFDNRAELSGVTQLSGC